MWPPFRKKVGSSFGYSKVYALPCPFRSNKQRIEFTLTSKLNVFCSISNVTDQRSHSIRSDNALSRKRFSHPMQTEMNNVNLIQIECDTKERAVFIITVL